MSRYINSWCARGTRNRVDAMRGVSVAGKAPAAPARASADRGPRARRAQGKTAARGNTAFKSARGAGALPPPLGAARELRLAKALVEARRSEQRTSHENRTQVLKQDCLDAAMAALTIAKPLDVANIGCVLLTNVALWLHTTAHADVARQLLSVARVLLKKLRDATGQKENTRAHLATLSRTVAIEGRRNSEWRKTKITTALKAARKHATEGTWTFARGKWKAAVADAGVAPQTLRKWIAAAKSDKKSEDTAR